MVSRGSNTRFRSRRLRGRWQSRLTGLMQEDFYPWGDRFSNNSNPAVIMSMTGALADPTADSGTLTITSGSIYVFGGDERYLTYSHVRFATGRVMRITAFTDTTHLEVTSEAYHAEDASGEFWLVRDDRDNPWPRTVLHQYLNGLAPQTPVETGLFSDPNGYEYGLVATQTGLWGFRDYERPYEITVPGGIPDGIVDIVQCFDEVLLLRGDDLPVLEWDGGPDNAFSGIADETDEVSYTAPMPNARMGIFVKDRLFVVAGRDTIYHSDIGVYTRFKEFESGYRVNQGTADSITCVYPYGDEAFLVGFSRSIYLVYNIRGDLSDMSIKLISSSVVIAGRQAVCRTGDDIWFMDTGGHIWPISRVDETRQQVGGTPVSWAIRPQMDEHGFQQTARVRMVGDRELVYVAFAGRDAPLDTMPSGRQLTRPNYVAVFDRVTKRWSGIDSYARFALAGWIQTRYASRQQLLFCGQYGGIYQYASESGESDWTADTRAYALDPVGSESTLSAAVRVYSQDATLTVEAVSDVVNETVVLADAVRRDRAKWLVHGRADRDPSNAQGDLAAPYRQDYALYLADAVDGVVLGEAGFRTDLLQSYLETFDLHGQPAHVQLRLTNSKKGSRCAIGAVAIAATDDGSDFGTE